MNSMQCVPDFDGVKLAMKERFIGGVVTSAPKKEGGMDFHNIQSFNLAIIAK